MKRMKKQSIVGVRRAVVARFAGLLFAASATSAALCALAAVCAPTSAFAQTGKQLTISDNTTLQHLDGGVTSVYFAGAYALTLADSQTLTPVFLNNTSGAILNLGSGTQTGQKWTLAGSSPRWTGRTNVISGNTLILREGVANPAGAYSVDGTAGYATTALQNGGTLQVLAGALGTEKENEVKIGALSTFANGAQPSQSAVVDVGANSVLTVENGVEVGANVGLTKTGAGTLQFLANGPASPVPGTGTTTGTSGTGTTTGTGTAGGTRTTPAHAINLGNLAILGGTVRAADGTAAVSDATITASSISLASGATLDLRKADTIQLAGSAGETVFNAGDGSTVNLYVDKSGKFTSYQATIFNTYVELGAATLNVVSDLKGKDAVRSMTVFSTEGVGQTHFDSRTLVVADNILGKRYAIDMANSTAEKLTLALQDAPKFQTIGKTQNARSVGSYLDRKIASGSYTDAEYAFLNNLETNQSALDLAPTTGEIYASTVGFAYLNNLTGTQTLFSVLRDNALAAYSGGGAVAPQNYESKAGQNAAYQGGAANGYFDPGNVYYETGSDPYGPGVAPAYEGGGAAIGTPAPAAGNYNFGWNAPLQRSALETVRGQAAYGDPGTLIYSAWFAALGGKTTAKKHYDQLGYDGEQYGMLAGLDLFGSCDCRFGLYYGFQKNDMKKNAALGDLKATNHQAGIYHQFGDEHVYNIATIRGGYDRYDTKRNIAVLSTTDSLRAKYNGWNAGASFERGANFALQPFVLTPYLAADYNFLARNSFAETSTTGSGYALKGDKSYYHSLRGIVGGRIALDMYPGQQHIRIAARAAYLHEFLNGPQGKTSLGFAALSGDEFTIYGNSLGRDWGLFGLGVDWAPIPAFVLFYEADVLANKYVDDVYNAAGLKFRW